jgi:hypothetical protein
MEAFNEICEFCGGRWQTSYINPMLVTAIIELNDKRCEVRFGAAQVSIPLP